MAQHKLYLFLLLSIFICLLHGTASEFEVNDDDDHDVFGSLLNEEDEVVMVQSGQKQNKRCDFSSGKWVFDESYPLYDSSCPYLSTAVTCQKNGRPDSDYQKWKWKPTGCSVPR